MFVSVCFRNCALSKKAGRAGGPGRQAGQDRAGPAGRAGLGRAGPAGRAGPGRGGGPGRTGPGRRAGPGGRAGPGRGGGPGCQYHRIKDVTRSVEPSMYLAQLWEHLAQLWEHLAQLGERFAQLGEQFAQLTTPIFFSRRTATPLFEIQRNLNSEDCGV